MYVTIWLLFDNIGRIPTFVGFEMRVCLSHAAIPCSYQILWLGHAKPRNGWQNIISGAGAGRLAGLSWPRRGSLMQELSAGGSAELEVLARPHSHVQQGVWLHWKACRDISCVCLVAPLQGRHQAHTADVPTCLPVQPDPLLDMGMWPSQNFQLC